MEVIERGTIAVDAGYYDFLIRQAEKINTVERVVNSEIYVTVETIASILDIEKKGK